MEKKKLRTNLERYESAIEEIKGIGNKKDSWLIADPQSEKWFYYIVCAIKYNTITVDMFQTMDEKPESLSTNFRKWHEKLRLCRNHPKWSIELYNALKHNSSK